MHDRPCLAVSHEQSAHLDSYQETQRFYIYLYMHVSVFLDFRPVCGQPWPLRLDFTPVVLFLGLAVDVVAIWISTAREARLLVCQRSLRPPQSLKPAGSTAKTSNNNGTSETHGVLKPSQTTPNQPKTPPKPSQNPPKTTPRVCFGKGRGVLCLVFCGFWVVSGPVGFKQWNTSENDENSATLARPQ